MAFFIFDKSSRNSSLRSKMRRKYSQDGLYVKRERNEEDLLLAEEKLTDITDVITLRAKAPQWDNKQDPLISTKTIDMTIRSKSNKKKEKTEEEIAEEEMIKKLDELDQQFEVWEKNADEQNGKI